MMAKTDQDRRIIVEILGLKIQRDYLRDYETALAQFESKARGFIDSWGKQWANLDIRSFSREISGMPGERVEDVGGKDLPAIAIAVRDRIDQEMNGFKNFVADSLLGSLDATQSEISKLNAKIEIDEETKEILDNQSQAEANVGDQRQGEAVEAQDSKEGAQPKLNDTGALMTIRDLMAAYKLPDEWFERVRKRLDRYRLDHKDGAGWAINEEPKGRESRFLYQIKAVRLILDDIRASAETSAKRPSKKK